MKQNNQNLDQQIDNSSLEKDGITNYILRLMLKNSRDIQKSQMRSAVGKLSGLVGIVCNLLLAGGKFVVGFLSGSVSITADALNNLSDAASSIVTLIGFKLAERPADADHPYGHARYEYLSGLAVAVMIIVIGFELAKSSVGKILNPTAVEFSFLTACVLFGSILVKIWLFLFNSKMGKMIHSTTLIATAADSRNDVITTSAVLTAAVVEYFTTWQIDGFMGLAVALFILYSGIDLAKETISPLLGEGANPELQELITDYISSCPKVLGCHDLMVHDYGPGKRFASIHVEMDKDENPLVCHDLIDDMERECLKNHGVHLVIHYDPVVTNNPELERLYHLVTAILKVKDERMSIHDFRMVPGTEHTNLIFDITFPAELRGQENTIKSALEKALNDLGEGTYYTVITFDPVAFK
ncbi:cation diffusion facilitator family transporter [Anaerosporobacter mobilis DSM 15930]|jgi:cation diffusion facilitator family transporter|uniref:Cation diffusion facilitator family transporter n=1 Tax=Anaerosporobacter mobilis DSM 15930 TaxID=1120996 RepID=A0A1M7I9H9_9FIRM|nr:cation diffusion facilitator family transporter [Anaerosporobacter mobilis]SHM37404.1 cation diffusion facilitator family transporter [Anaerosporobacter mobilis DSM 15930]